VWDICSTGCDDKTDLNFFAKVRFFWRPSSVRGGAEVATPGPRRASTWRRLRTM